MPRCVRSSKYRHRIRLVFDRQRVRLHQLSETCLPPAGRVRPSRALSLPPPAAASSRAGNRSVNFVPRPTSLSTVIVPSSCSTIRFEIARPRPRPRRFVVTKSSKMAAQPFGRDARPGVLDRHLDEIADARRRNRDASALLGRLNRVRDQVAVDAAEREAIAFDDERPRGVPRLERPRRRARLRRASTRRSRRSSR